MLWNEVFPLAFKKRSDICGAQGAGSYQSYASETDRAQIQEQLSRATKSILSDWAITPSLCAPGSGPLQAADWVVDWAAERVCLRPPLTGQQLRLASALGL